MKNRIKLSLLVILVLLMAIQLSPIGLDEYYEKFRLGIMVITSILFLFEWNIKAIWQVGLFRTFILTLVFEVILLGAFSFVGAEVVWGPIINLLMVLMFLMISFMDLSLKQYKWVLQLFLIGVLFSGISIIFTYGNGFVINDLYMPVPKNQIAPILSLGFLIAFFLGNQTKKVKNKYYYWGIACLLFVCICVFRARANIVASLIGLFVYFVFYKRKIRIMLFAAIGTIVILIVTPVGEFVYNAFFANYDITDLNSISAGRTSTYGSALKFISDNWAFGRMTSSVESYHQGNVHNYLLYTLENYGIWGGGLLIVFYLRLLFEVGKKNIFGYRNGFYTLGCFVFIIPLVVSLFEYTYPYAPGSAVFMAYFCFGQYYRKMLWETKRSCA